MAKFVGFRGILHNGGKTENKIPDWDSGVRFAAGARQGRSFRTRSNLKCILLRLQLREDPWTTPIHQLPTAVFGQPGEMRAEKHYQFSASLEVPLWDHLSIVGEYKYVSRQSNLASADYNESIFALAFKYDF